VADPLIYTNNDPASILTIYPYAFYNSSYPYRIPPGGGSVSRADLDKPGVTKFSVAPAINFPLVSEQSKFCFILQDSISFRIDCFNEKLATVRTRDNGKVEINKISSASPFYELFQGADDPISDFDFELTKDEQAFFGIVVVNSDVWQYSINISNPGTILGDFFNFSQAFSFVRGTAAASVNGLSTTDAREGCDIGIIGVVNSGNSSEYYLLLSTRRTDTDLRTASEIPITPPIKSAAWKNPVGLDLRSLPGSNSTIVVAVTFTSGNVMIYTINVVNGTNIVLDISNYTYFRGCGISASSPDLHHAKSD